MTVFHKIAQLWRKQFEEEVIHLSKEKFDISLQHIFERSAENLEDRLVHLLESAAGDTPIEKALWLALKIEIDIGFHEHTQLLTMPRGGKFDQKIYSQNEGIALVVEPQLQLTGWRPDFVIHTAGFKPRLIVECDGHDFHERTKEQAARDRSRDRAFQLKGYTVLRFTGSEIWRDPCGCVDQILDWATRVEPFA